MKKEYMEPEFKMEKILILNNLLTNSDEVHVGDGGGDGDEWDVDWNDDVII